MTNKLALKAHIHNRFDFFKTDVNTGKTEQIAQAENIILNGFWSKMFATTNSNGHSSRMAFGTGTGTLSAARTTMFNQLGYKNVTEVSKIYDSSAHVWARRVSITLNETEYVGSTLSEVSLADSFDGVLTTHALLMDMNNNPVTILKTSTDIITIYATVYAVLEDELYDSGCIIVPNTRLTANLPPLINWLLTGGVAENVVSTFYAKYLACCAPITYDANSQQQFQVLQVTPTISRSSSTKKLTFTMPRLAVGSANVAGGLYGLLLYAGGSSLQKPVAMFSMLGITNWAGSFLEGESIGTGDGSTVDFKTAFGHVRSGAVVYVDGVADTGATVDVGKPYSANLMKVLRLVETNSHYMTVGNATNYNYSAISPVQGAYAIWENPFYATYGIDQFKGLSDEVYMSNDLETWQLIGTLSSNLAVPGAYRNYRYIKVIREGTETNMACFYEANSNDLAGNSVKNVHLSSAPSAGAAVTIDYTTDVIAKDIYHVFDMVIELTLAEYTG